MKTPILTPDQLKRLRLSLLALRLQKNPTSARKSTSNATDCARVAIQLFAKFGVPESLNDVADLYVVDDDPKSIKPKRGKGKAPSKKLYPVRLDPSMLEQLRSLDGSVSGHIRVALQEYLDRII